MCVCVCHVYINCFEFHCNKIWAKLVLVFSFCRNVCDLERKSYSIDAVILHISAIKIINIRQTATPKKKNKIWKKTITHYFGPYIFIIEKSPINYAYCRIRENLYLHNGRFISVARMILNVMLFTIACLWNMCVNNKRQIEFWGNWNTLMWTKYGQWNTNVFIVMNSQ